jgi:ribose 5-phosphate isomerase RpiB
MRIAVVTEVSTVRRNADIIGALEGRGLDVLNAGMKGSGPDEPELTYINTGLLASLILNAGRADMVIGGCGTGQGFMISATQYTGVVCGLLLAPLDAWLFNKINSGNCVSLALNQGYGWGSDVNLRLMFDQLFTGERGSGYPEHRRDSQARSRGLLAGISAAAHRPMGEVLRSLDATVVDPVLRFPGVLEVLDADSLEDQDLAQAVRERAAAAAES